MIVLQKPLQNSRFLPPPERMSEDGVKGTEQGQPIEPPVTNLPPPMSEAGVKGSEQFDSPATLGAPTNPNPTLPPPTAPARILSPLQQSEEKYTNLQNQETPKDNDKSFLKRLGATLREFGKRALSGSADLGPNASMSDRLWARLGSGIGGAIGYQIDPQVDERENLQNQRAKAWRDYQMQNDIEKQRQERARTAAQTQEITERTKSIPIDDENKRLQITYQKEAQKNRTQSQMLSKLVNLKHFNPTDPQHLALAKEAGQDVENLKGWDDRDPKVKQVAGISYKYDYQTQSYTPTNLPTDESKTLKDYAVTMPNGEVRTYKVSQKDAANFSTQMTTLGARLEQDAKKYNNDNYDQYNREYSEISGKVAGANEKIGSLQQRLNQLNNTTNPLEKIAAADEIKQIQTKLSEAQGEKAQYETQLKNLKKPERISVSSVGSYSESQFREIMKSDGKTPEQVEFLVKQARTQGIIK